MQDITQGGMHPGEKHISPSRILPGLPEIPVPRSDIVCNRNPVRFNIKKREFDRNKACLSSRYFMPQCNPCHCEEQSNEAIQTNISLHWIASLRSQ
jgi:hypothetical protein